MSGTAAVGAESSRPVRPGMREAFGALNGAASSIAIATALGTLVFSPLGPQVAAVGVAAALIATIVGGAIAALATSTPLTISSPRAATGVVIAGFVAAVHRSHPDLPDAAVIALTCIACVTAGMVQVSAAALHMGRIVRFVPFPVIAGFTHGVAIVLLLSYLPLLVGGATTPGMRWPDWSTASWGPFTLGVVATAVAFAAGRAGFKLPAVFAALAVAVAAQVALTRWLPGFDPGAMVKLSDIGLVGQPFMEWSSVPHTLRDPLLATQVLSFAIVIACVASIDSLIGTMAIEARFGIRSKPDRDLFAQGLGNIAAGSVGGIAISYAPVQAAAAHAAGARTRWAGPLAAVLVAGIALAFALLVDGIALAVIAGLMVFVACRLADPWGFALLGKVARKATRNAHGIRAAFLVYLLVALSVVLLDIVSALGMGVAVAAVIFIRTMNMHVVRRVTLGPSLRSRRLFPPSVSRRLAERLHSVALIELQGPLFFGTADRLVEEVEKLPAAVQFVVFDLRRVQAIDTSANAVLTRLHARLKGEQRQIALSGRPAGLGTVDGSLPPTFPDRDRAMEWVEERLLAGEDITLAAAAVPAQAFADLAGLDESSARIVLEAANERSLRKGDTIFRYGDPSDHLYFLLSGRISIMHGAGDAAIRVVTFLPGNVFGDVAFIDGQARSASAICEVDSRVLQLHRVDLENLARESPEAFTRLYRFLANDLAARLRAADRLVRDSQ